MINFINTNHHERTLILKMFRIGFSSQLLFIISVQNIDTWLNLCYSMADIDEIFSLG